MKFLGQVWFDTEKSSQVTREEWDAVTQQCIVSDDHWRDSGHMLSALALYEPEQAVTLRVRNGTVAATDGPFAEIKEHLGGFVVIDAKDMEEAKAIISTFPILKYASIEIRPAYSIKDGR